MNSVKLIGNIGRQVEAKTTANGKMYAYVSIGVNGPRKEDKTEWFDAIAWGKTAEYLAKYTSVGDTIAISGRLNKSSYTDAGGNKVYQTRVVVGSFERVALGRIGRGKAEACKARKAMQDTEPETDFVELSEEEAAALPF